MNKRLIHLEQTIDTNRQWFYDVGRSLREIRDKRLYRDALFNRFEAYTKERFDIGKSKAYRLINASDVIDNLSPIGNRVPSNEAQTRPLTRFTKKEQQAIWRQFLESSVGVSAQEINRFIKKHHNHDDLPGTCRPVDRISESYENAVMALMEEIKTAQNDNWTSTSRHTALIWNRKMREKIEFCREKTTGGNNGQRRNLQNQ